MTIDSFCLSLIRDHFNCLDIDPGFRIGDEGELLLLRADVMEEMPEAHYEQADETFEQFVDTYASGKADGGIEYLSCRSQTFSQIIRGLGSGSVSVNRNWKNWKKGIWKQLHG